MAPQQKPDRRQVVDQIRNQQAGGEKARGWMLVGGCVLVALLIVAAAAWQPIKNSLDRRGYADQDLADIGAAAGECQDITTARADGAQQHVQPGTPVSYPEAPPAFGQHYDIWADFDTKFYTESDRPDLGELVHNLEHGYTLLWYDETAADDAQMMDDIRGLASKFEESDNLRTKFKAVPWTSEDGKAFPDGQHIAYTHWSIGGVGESNPEKQVGAWQYCSAPSGEALAAFMEEYPYLDSPEPTVL